MEVYAVVAQLYYHCCNSSIRSLSKRVDIYSKKQNKIKIVSSSNHKTYTTHITTAVPGINLGKLLNGIWSKATTPGRHYCK